MTKTKLLDQMIDEFNTACLNELLNLQRVELKQGNSHNRERMEFWRRMVITQCPHGKDDNV